MTTIRQQMISYSQKLALLPRHQRGEMLAEASILRRSDDPKDRAVGYILREQVLCSMDSQVEQQAIES